MKFLKQLFCHHEWQWLGSMFFKCKKCGKEKVERL